MKTIIFNEIFKPMLHRVGTALGVWLASLDAFTDGQIATLENAAIIVSGLVFDLLVRKVL